jgi:hypothetical protein
MGSYVVLMAPWQRMAVTGALGLLLLGCPRQVDEARETEEPPAPLDETPSPVQREAAEEAALARAAKAAGALGQTLKDRLTEAMAEGGPARAMTVCADEAQALTAQVGERFDVSVGRSALRLRNPKNEGPEWVHAWLQEQGDRPAAQAEPLTRVVDDRAQVVRPIAMGGVCLSCHGPAEGIPPAVQAVLRERYPQDQATGFREGDLRGALWAQARVANGE